MSDIDDIEKQNKMLKNKIKKLEEDIEQRTRNYMLRSKHYPKIIETRSQDIQVNTLNSIQQSNAKQSNFGKRPNVDDEENNQKISIKDQQNIEQSVTMQNFQFFINKNNTAKQLQRVKQFVKVQFKHFQQLILKQRQQIQKLKAEKKKINDKYQKLKKERKQDQTYFKEAIFRSEQQNYQFRMEIRKLASLSRVNLHEDTIQTNCNQSLAKKVQQTLSDLSFSDIKAKTLNENIGQQNNQQFRKALSAEIYSILNCIPVESADNFLLFQPQTQQQILAALKEVKSFCQRYQQNLSFIDKKLQVYEQQVRSLLKSMVQGHNLDKQKVIEDIQNYKELERVKYFLIKHISENNSLQKI